MQLQLRSYHPKYIIASNYEWSHPLNQCLWQKLRWGCQRRGCQYWKATRGYMSPPAAWHCYEKYLPLFVTLSNKCTCTFKLSWTNYSKHLNCTFSSLRTDKVFGVPICCRSGWGLLSSHQNSKMQRKTRKKPKTTKQNLHGFSAYWKLLQGVPKEVISSPNSRFDGSANYRPGLLLLGWRQPGLVVRQAD